MPISPKHLLSKPLLFQLQTCFQWSPDISIWMYKEHHEFGKSKTEFLLHPCSLKPASLLLFPSFSFAQAEILESLHSKYISDLTISHHLHIYCTRYS